MNCRKVFLREFLTESCTSTFIFDKLKKHRENVLLEREKALLPATQQHVILYKEKKKINMNIAEVNNEIKLMERQLATLKNRKNTLTWDLVRLANGDVASTSTSTAEPKLFVRKCPIEECRGFLSNKWICGSCESEICSKCNEHKLDNHECNEDSVKSMELLKKDTKPCPSCGTMIHKYIGCSQVWCTECHTAFSWITGIIVTGVIHNPHYYEYLRKTNNGVVPRTPGDIPGGCGQGIPGIYNFQGMLRLHALNEITVSLLFSFHRSISHIQHEETRNHVNPNDNNLNKDLRVLYLMNEISEEHFKKTIQQKEKRIQKDRDFNNVYQMVVDVGGDIIRQIVANNTREYTVNSIRDITGLVTYFNDSIEAVGKQYKCVYPGINPNFTFEYNYAEYLVRQENQRLRTLTAAN